MKHRSGGGALRAARVPPAKEDTAPGGTEEFSASGVICPDGGLCVRRLRGCPRAPGFRCPDGSGRAPLQQTTSPPAVVQLRGRAPTQGSKHAPTTPAPIPQHNLRTGSDRTGPAAPCASNLCRCAASSRPSLPPPPPARPAPASPVVGVRRDDAAVAGRTHDERREVARRGAGDAHRRQRGRIARACAHPHNRTAVKSSDL